MEHVVLEGWLYSTQSSKRHPARMLLSEDGFLDLKLAEPSVFEAHPHQLDDLKEGEAREFLQVPIGECEFSDRIGNTPRFISHPSFGRFETRENHEVDFVLRHYHQQGKIRQGIVSRLAYRLESNLRVVALTVVLTTFVGFLFIRYGMPWGANVLAHALPERVVRELGSGSLELLDDIAFYPSKLTPEKKETVRKELLDVAQRSGVNGVRVVFRYNEDIGANAFALPDATIVFMDDMVELATDNEELASVMLHELGHVEYRHSMRRVIQQSGLGLMVLLAIGDVNSASQLVIALPTLLLDAHYSREMEIEADDYAYQKMLESGLNPRAFASLMRRVIQAEEQGDEAMQHSRAASMLATHPDMEERLRRFEQH